MSKFFSKEYRYNLLCSANIQVKPINSVEALINFVIGANNRIINQKEQGWIYAEKIRVSGPDETVLYGKRVDLPLLEDNPYFDNLLSPFHTKKTIDFVEMVPNPEEKPLQTAKESKEEFSETDIITKQSEKPSEEEQIPDSSVPKNEEVEQLVTKIADLEKQLGLFFTELGELKNQVEALTPKEKEGKFPTLK